MTVNPPSPPIKETPLVGVFFIGAEGEPLEVSASREKGQLETPTGRLVPERSEEVQYLSISDTKGPESNMICSVRVFF